MSSREYKQKWLGDRKGLGVRSIEQLKIQKEAFCADKTGLALIMQQKVRELDGRLGGSRDRCSENGSLRPWDSDHVISGVYGKCQKGTIDNQKAWNNIPGDVACCLRECERSSVLAMGPGNLPAGRVRTGYTIVFCSWPVHKPDLDLLGGPNRYMYPWTHWFCRVWIDPSLAISGSRSSVLLFMVAVRYVTAKCKILTLVNHSLYLFNWLRL